MLRRGGRHLKEALHNYLKLLLILFLKADWFTPSPIEQYMFSSYSVRNSERKVMSDPQLFLQIFCSYPCLISYEYYIEHIIHYEPILSIYIYIHLQLLHLQHLYLYIYIYIIYIYSICIQFMSQHLYAFRLHLYAFCILLTTKFKSSHRILASIFIYIYSMYIYIHIQHLSQHLHAFRLLAFSPFWTINQLILQEIGSVFLYFF